MKNFYFLIFILASLSSFSQTGTEFWFAPPNVTDLHRPTDKDEVYLNVTCLDQASTIHIWQPANLGGVDITVTLPANTSQKIYLGANIADLETKPTATVLNTGLLVESTEKITAYYEYDNYNNPDIFALKGANSLGTQFYIPLHNYSGFPNHDFSTSSFDDMAYTSFDIIASEDGTRVVVYPTSNVDGSGHHEYILNKGQTASIGWTGADYTDPNTHPYGSMVRSDKPIAISIKDDSSHNPSGGCYDLMGDQIVPINIVGYEYIVVQGELNHPNGGESFFVLATEDNTELYINGSATPITTLLAGETYRYEIAAASGQEYTYVRATEPIYLTHVTGFGCEEGIALLPPLNCAGSSEVSFVRSTNEAFFTTILVRTASTSDFTITPASAQTVIDNATWTTVPGTNNEWSATKVQFTTGEIPTGGANMLTNSSDVFAMGLINGGGSSGCRYGYFSEYVAAIIADAGTDATICANSSIVLNGTVTGGAITGIWTSSGTGIFDDATNLNAEYTPSPADATAGSITLTITSTGYCNPQTDNMILSFDPAPTVDAGADQTVCGNNANVQLNGTITIATGGNWSSSGDGSFDNSTLMNATYTPGATDIANGTVRLYLSTTGNFTCNTEVDSMDITITLAPTINAGVDQTSCSNSAEVTLSATTNGVPTGGIWTGGTGSFNPGNSALNTLYNPSAPEIANGNVTLTVTSTGNGTCTEVSDDIVLTFSATPIVDAGPNQTKCSNNEVTDLAGTISGGASAGTWSNGLGTFVVDNNDLNASYTPTATEIANGSVTLTLTTTDHTTNGCNAVSDQMIINFTPKPTVDAGTDQTVCGNNADVQLNGTITIATGGSWSSSGNGNFDNNTLMDATYTPSVTDITNGTVRLYLSTTGNGTCSMVKDSMTVTITAAPTIDAGLDQTVCANNADITLNGSATIATGFQWTGGSGSFNPGNTAINTIYSPTAAEISSGNINLTLLTTAQGTCNPVSDNINITFTASPVVNAGNDQVKCANNEVTDLAGTISGGASAGTWSNGLGTFVIDNNDLNASYTPTATEIANGSVTLTLTTTDHTTNGCSAVSDQMTINFTNAPTIDAGTDMNVCQNNSDAQQSAVINSIPTGVNWAGGSGSFDNNSFLNALYFPSAAEISAGNPITLTVTTTGSGTCTEVSDQVIVNFDPSPIVNAGADQTSCENNPTVTLAGSVVNAGGGSWTGSTGSFTGGSTNLLANFTPSITDITNGGVSLTLTSITNGNCNAESDIFDLTILPSPIVDAGSDATYCTNNSTINLNGSITNATGGLWSGGLGIFGDANSTSTTYQPSQTELDNGSVTLLLTSTGNGTCNAVQDDVTFTFTTSPTVDAGIDQTVCANNSDIILTGAITIASGGTWSGGLGNYTPNADDLGATYHPTAAEISAQSVSLTLTSTGNGTCNLVTDIIDIIINPSPIVNAGSDIHTCYNSASATLNGNITNASGGIWSGGSGTFAPNNITLNATYTPTQTEIDAGQIKLYLTSTGNASCNAVIDSILIIIDPAPIVDAGIDQTLCANNSDAVLNGSISIASGGVWSGGLGLFSPNNSLLNATYTPTASDIANGSVDLILTSTGNGTCNTEEDIITIYYTPAPTIDAGVDFDVCANNNQIDLSGIVSIASGGTWAGGTGTYNPDANTLSTSYTPTPTEINNGTLTFTLTSTGNGFCNSVSDDIDITINASPIVNAGEDQNVCVDNLTASLNGSISGITNSGSWTSLGTGYFVPNNTTLNADYVCSSADSTVGSVLLILTSNNNAVCNAESDSLNINILPAGQVNAGTDQTVCANNSAVSLNGIVSGGATTGIWSTTGTGVFVPDVNTLNATYIPSSGDTLTGIVTLTLTANSCNVATNSIDITITPAPQVNAGLDQIVCVDDLNIQLDASVYGGTSTGQWSTSGTGMFIPNNTTIDAIYHASTQDSINGVIELILSSTNYGLCNVVRDTMQINISPAGIVNAGQDQTYCSNNAIIPLNGTITGGASEGQWGTSGSGYFLPSPDSLNATYTPSTADLATGNVTLVLSATNSCNFAFDALTINFTPAPTADAGADQTVCGNNAELSLSGSYTLASGALWSTNGTGTFSPSNTNMSVTYSPSATDIANGGNNILLTTTGNGGCNAVTDTLVFNITPSPIVNAGINQSVCSSADSTQLYGIISGGSSTGQWTTNGTGTFSDNTDLNAIYYFSSADILAGTVQITLTSTNNGNCNPESNTMTITFGNSAFAYAGVDQTICGDNLLANLTGIISGGASTGIWSSTGTGTFVPNPNNLNTSYICSSTDSTNGNVSLILSTTNNGTCQAGIDSMTVIINPVPFVDAGIDIEVCKGIDSIAVAGLSTNVASVKWTTTGTGTFSPSDTLLGAYYIPSSTDTLIGSINLVLSSVNSGICNEISDTLNILFSVPLIINFNNSLACENQSVNFTDNTSILTGNINSWYWEFGDGSVDNNQNATHAYLAEGNYTVTLTVASDLGCSYNKSETITVYPSPTSDFAYTSDCYLDAVVFTDASTTNVGTINSWSWNFGDTLTSNLPNPTHNYVNSGSYITTLIVQNSQGCSASSNQNIVVHPKPISDFNYSYNCSNGLVTFTDGSSSQGNPITIYNWNFGDGGSSTDANPTYTFTTEGNHSVTLISGSSNICSDTISMQVYLQSITANFSFVNQCAYDSIPFTNLSNANGDTIIFYSWSFGDGNYDSKESPNHKYLVSNNYDVQLIIKSNSGCSDTIAKTVEAYPVPSASFDYYSEEYIEGNSIEFTDYSSGSETWQWSFGDGITSSIQNPTHVYTTASNYLIIQMVSNNYSCIDSAITNLIIKESLKILPPKLPTAFSPNGDQMNDIYYPRGGPFKNIDFRIYNSWGKQIFSTTEIDKGWDGTYKGIEQQIGVYVWTISAITIDGKSYVKTGDVTLIR